jgi:predicted O-linked N-acetylglucosamine transferase (SPINDLY family)
MYLMAQVFEEHENSRFQIFSYSYGPDKQDEMRDRLVKSVDVFHDVRTMTDLQIVKLAREERLDIAIDLKGFTKDTRLGLFAYGLAPIQISYLGYPGTTGAKFMDYIVADPIVIPDDKRLYYSEQIIYLPNTYQPTDRKRSISEKLMTRSDEGLPSDSFVFCCFNNNYKISAREFDIWMRLLAKAEGSVLWLLKSNGWSENHLKKEAEARGVNADRLIFADRLPQAEHIARHKLADLFLDTFNYNAHTTASDALWGGLPLVTKAGEGFAARVASSLLSAIGLPELITNSEKNYEALCLDLFESPKRLSEIKRKLMSNRLTHPLFDPQKYTRHLENGYELAYQRYLDGKQADVIFIPE